MSSLIAKLKKILSTNWSDDLEKELSKEIAEHEMTIKQNHEKELKTKHVFFENNEILESKIQERIKRERVDFDKEKTTLEKELRNLKNLNFIMKNDGKEEEAEQIIALASTFKDKNGNPLDSEAGILKVLEKYNNFKKVFAVEPSLQTTPTSPTTPQTQTTNSDPAPKVLPKGSKADPNPTQILDGLEAEFEKMTKAGARY